MRATEEEKENMRVILERMKTQIEEGATDVDPHDFPDMTRSVRNEDDDGIFWNESESDDESLAESDDAVLRENEAGSRSSEDEADEELRKGAEPGKSEFRSPRENEGHDEDEDADHLEQLLEELDELELDYDEALARLPPALANEFKRQLADGRISSLVSAWRPWWLRETLENPAVENVKEPAEDDAGVTEGIADAPRCPAAVDLELAPSIAYDRAADLVVFSVIDVLVAYCITLRRLNGDWRASPTNAAKMLSSLSAALTEDARHEDTRDALSAVVQRQSLPSSAACIAAASDAAAVMRIPGGIPRALLEARDILSAASRKGKMLRMSKKVGFLLSYSVGGEETVAHRGRVLQIAAEVESWADRELEMDKERALLRTGQSV